IALEDHFTAEEINAAVGRDAGFTEAFPGEAQAELHDLRALFQHKALIARQGRLCDELLAAGRGEEDLVTLRLHELPAGADAARLHAYHEPLKLDEIDEPKATGPLEVVVRIGAAGLCRTDLHIQEGQWAEKSQVKLPYTPGHENAGWVHEVGPAVTNVAVGDTVIVHPFITCGLCRACRAGDDMHCVNGSFPGINRDGEIGRAH